MEMENVKPASFAKQYLCLNQQGFREALSGCSSHEEKRGECLVGNSFESKIVGIFKMLHVFPLPAAEEVIGHYQNHLQCIVKCVKMQEVICIFPVRFLLVVFIQKN